MFLDIGDNSSVTMSLDIGGNSSVTMFPYIAGNFLFNVLICCFW
jgi:hypothetical protein